MLLVKQLIAHSQLFQPQNCTVIFLNIQAKGKDHHLQSKLFLNQIYQFKFILQKNASEIHKPPKIYQVFEFQLIPSQLKL